MTKVALLRNKDRLHFWFAPENQMLSHDDYDGDRLKVPAKCKGGIMEYSVRVSFYGGLFGSFSQWLTFDFGTRPVVVRKLNVDVDTEEVQERMETLRQNLQMDRYVIIFLEPLFICCGFPFQMDSG